MTALEKQFNEFDILYRNLFKANSNFSPLNEKQPHPLDIRYNEDGLFFEIACTGLTKEDIKIEVEQDTLRISYTKPKDEEIDYSEYIYKGLSKKSFNLAYKIAPKFNLENIQAQMENGLLVINIAVAEESKPKQISII
jgi:HSP20 family protein